MTRYSIHLFCKLMTTLHGNKGSPTNILYQFDVGPIYRSTSGRHRLSCRSDIGCATRLDVGPMSAAYQTTILVRCRVALHFRFGPTSAFNLGWISVIDTLPTFLNPPFNPCCQSKHVRLSIKRTTKQLILMKILLI